MSETDLITRQDEILNGVADSYYSMAAESSQIGGHTHLNNLKRFLAISGSVVASGFGLTGVAEANTSKASINPATVRGCAAAAVREVKMNFDFSPSDLDPNTSQLELTEEASPMQADINGVTVNCEPLFQRDVTAQLMIESYNRSGLIPDSGQYEINQNTLNSVTNNVNETDAAAGCLDDGQIPIYAEKETVELKGIDGMPSYSDNTTSQINIESQTVANCAPNTRDQETIGGSLTTGLVETDKGSQLGGQSKKKITPLNPNSLPSLIETNFNNLATPDTFSMDINKIVFERHVYLREGTCNQIGSTTSKYLLYGGKGLTDVTCTKVDGKYQKEYAPYPQLIEKGFTAALNETGDEVGNSVGISDEDLAPTKEVKESFDVKNHITEATISFYSSNVKREPKEIVLRKQGKHRTTYKVIWTK